MSGRFVPRLGHRIWTSAVVRFAEITCFSRKLVRPFAVRTAHPSRERRAPNHNAAVLVMHMIFGFWNTTHGASRRFPPRRLWTSATHRSRNCDNARHAGPFPLQIPPRRHPVGGARGVPASGQIGGPRWHSYGRACSAEAPVRASFAG